MIDLTQQLNGRTPHVPGDPEVHIDIVGAALPWRVSSICMGSHSGTHMDAPRHLFPHGRDLASFDVSRFVGAGLVIDARGHQPNVAIGPSVLEGIRDRVWPGWFAMIHSGWDVYWEDASYFEHPYLSRQLAEALTSLGVGLVGIDALSVDSTVNAGSAAHEVLLRSEVLIVENLCRLSLLNVRTTYAFACLPLAFADADGAPARVVAWTMESRFPPGGHPETGTHG